MRVAFITVGDTSRRTGGYLYHTPLFKGLREKGVEVAEIVPCGATSDEQLAASSMLGSAFTPKDFDVIMVDALSRILVSPWLDHWRRTRPVVAMVHELPSVAGGEDPESEESLLRADRLVTVSDHGRTILADRGVPVGRISVVPPGFDRPQTGDDGNQCSSLDSDTRALCVAQWIERKGILTLVEAWNMRERPEAVLALIGETNVDPAYSAAVRREIERFPGARINAVGPVDDDALSRAYASADLFVLPSRYEGYGVVYAEALAHGLPVIACNVGPVPDLVGNEAAILVPPEDVGALSEALDLLLGDAARRRRMSDAARRRAESLPRWKDTVRGFHEVLLTAVTERGG